VCGILGIHNYASCATPITGELLTRMTDTIRHRGPDDAGLWMDRSGTVGLGFRRLSIIDLSANGHQPMANENGTVHIVFNGEIYNFRDLRPSLEGKGHRFRSNTDMEVILHLYEDLGPACLEQLDGMFAFAIWDDRKRAWFIARDRLGVKPLYYTQQQGMLLFASEIKAILAHPQIRADLNPEAMGQYLAFKTTPAPLTMFAGIHKLPAGHFLTADSGGNLLVHSYWDAVSAARPAPQHFREEEIIANIRDLFSQAVTKRMIADVPVGAFLSGGLDSSAVVAEMAGRSSGRVKTFSVGVRDFPQYSEFAFARQIAERFATDHHEIEIGVREVEEYLPHLVHQQDEPLADPVCVPLHYVSKLAANAGVPVVLVGEGSDEQFFGYDTRIAFFQRYRRFWRPLLSLPQPGLAAGYQAARVLHRATGLGGRVENVLRKASTGAGLFSGSVAFGDEARANLLAPGTAGDTVPQQVVARIMDDLRREWPQAEIGAQVMYLDLKIRLAELLLMRVDKITMSQSLEAREPFLDYHLIEYTMALPMTLKLKGWNPKHLFKEAMRGRVPDAIVDRPKQPFAAPIEEWLRQGLGGFARRVILNSHLRERGLLRYDRIERILADHERGAADHGVQIWTLMNLSAWYDHWIHGENRA
jgi:asparagine synthase (glutamine-hydrolysing)